MENVQNQSKTPYWSAILATVSLGAAGVALTSLFGPAAFHLFKTDAAISILSVTALTGSFSFSEIAHHLMKKKPEKTGDQLTISHEKLKVISTADPELRARLQRYLKRHPTTISSDLILSHARAGKKHVRKLLDGEELKYENPIQAREQATQIIWFFTLAHLAQEGEGADSWTWKIEDPNGKITEFFTKLPHAYERPSTHFAKEATGNQYGYDFVEGQLPGSKRSALIMPLKSNEHTMLGIKLETWGFNTVEHKFMHTLEYIKTRVVPSGTIHRKEHPPKGLKKTFGKRPIWEIQNEKAVKKLGLNALNVRTGNEVILEAAFLKK